MSDRRSSGLEDLTKFDNLQWMSHSVGRGPSSWRQCCACTVLLDPHALHRARMAGFIAVKLLGNARLSTVPRATHSANGLARREVTRGNPVGAGKDFAGSPAAPSSA